MELQISSDKHRVRNLVTSIQFDVAHCLSIRGRKFGENFENAFPRMIRRAKRPGRSCIGHVARLVTGFPWFPEIFSCSKTQAHPLVETVSCSGISGQVAATEVLRREPRSRMRRGTFSLGGLPRGNMWLS